MPPIPIRRLPAGSGVAIEVEAGRSIKIVNVHGKQIVTLWAHSLDRPEQSLSMAHTRTANSKIAINVGDTLFSDASAPLLLCTQDTSPGVHDTLVSACDAERYKRLGNEQTHANCADNYRSAIQNAKSKSLIGGRAPASPLNLFMNVSVAENGALTIATPTSEKGQYICLKAIVDVMLVMSACPMDLDATNNFSPTDVQYIVLD